MADLVQTIMEKMTIYLQDLETNGLFSHEEISSIIRKRRNMEYNINSHTRSIQDYITAIEYEINLETLRKMRKRRIGLNKGLVSDNHIVSRIMFTFERMTKRYAGDLNVWLKYVEYCEINGHENKLAVLYPKILQYHPRAESVWVKAANWEMGRGNFNNARLLLQRSIRINKTSKLLWKEYFRFELLYINVVEERRRILGLSSLRDRLLGDAKDASLKDLVDQAACDEEKEDMGETATPEESTKTDLELLEDEEENEMKEENEDEENEDEENVARPMEIPEDEEERLRENRRQINQNVHVDKIINESSEEMQAQFLRGAIPKVVFKHALEACDDRMLAVELLRIAYELGNVFVEQAVLQGILDQDSHDLAIWKELITYPVARITDELEDEEEESEKDELLQKRKKTDFAESMTMVIQLAEQAESTLQEKVDAASITVMIIQALTAAAKAMSIAGDVSQIYEAIDHHYQKAMSAEIVNGDIVAEMTRYYASRGQMQECVECIYTHQAMLLASVEPFLTTMTMLISVANRADYLIVDVFHVNDVQKFLIQLFNSGIQRFRTTEKGEDLLRVSVRYLKYLISINYAQDKIEKIFKDTFAIVPELNGPVFVLYLSYSFEQGMDSLRRAVDFALTHEVLIPLTSEIINECIDYEKKWMAGLDLVGKDKDKEEKISRTRIEKLYDLACKRDSQNADLWIEYIEFERMHGGYANIKVIYNRAIHSLEDMAAFEEKFNLLQARSHL